MSTQMDGVKINVNNEKDKSVPQEKKKPVRGRPKKSPTPKAEKKVEKEKKIEKVKKTLKEDKGFLPLVFAIVFTALIVGGVIYAWQSLDKSKSLEKVSLDARGAREEFEQRLENLKTKLTGTEKEKEELLAEKKRLEEKARLLESARIKYENSDIGISFMYPASFGEAKIEFIEAASGTKFIGTFSENDKLVFSGTSADYEREATSTIRDFGLTLGFIDKNNKYYYQPGGEGETSEFEIQPTKIIGLRSGEVLLVDKKSFVGQDDFSRNAGKPFVDIGENIGGLVNTGNDDYPGVAFVNMDFGLMPLESFEEMLKSVEFR